MQKMRSIQIYLLAGLIAGCATPKYGQERQLTFSNGTHPVWAIAPAVNLSGEMTVDPLLQADLLYHQLQAVNNLTIIPVNRVVQVYAALHIRQVESQEQASIVCEQLGCDALVIPTMTVYDAYNPPKIGAALQLLSRRSGGETASNVNARELTRQATPLVTEALPTNPGFIQVVGMYDAANGSVRDAVLRYARGRNDPTGPMGANEYFVCMDRYSEFVYHTLIEQMIDRVTGQAELPAQTAQTAGLSQPPQIGLTAQAN
jgi:hypothetical protein